MKETLGNVIFILGSRMPSLKKNQKHEKKISKLKNKGRKYSYERWKNKGRKIGK